MTRHHVPAISAIVCTRNRGESAVATIKSILASDCTDFEVILVDQSTDQVTEDAIELFCSDPRFRYIHATTKGVSRARNLGVATAKGEIIAFTDDDCMVPSSWLDAITHIFTQNPRVTIAFCNVEAAPYDTSRGFTPAYTRANNKIVRNFADKCRARGIGAGMAVRRESILSIGGFDEMLGPGADFPACEDGDLAMRALIQGQWIYETHEVAVLHYGFRTWSEGKELTRRDWIGIGAAYAKPLRCGHWGALVVVLYESLVMGLLIPLSDILRLQKPQGLRRILYFLEGFWQGWSTPIDREKMLFRSAPLTNDKENSKKMKQ